MTQVWHYGKYGIILTMKNYLHVEVVYLTERREYHFQIQGQLVVARWIYCDYINFALCKCSLEYSLEWSFWVRFTTPLEVVCVKFNRIRVFNSKYKKKFGRLDPVVNTVVMCLSRPIILNFLKAVFHKFYLVHSWILWPVPASSLQTVAVGDHKQNIFFTTDNQWLFELMNWIVNNKWFPWYVFKIVIHVSLYSLISVHCRKFP